MGSASRVEAESETSTAENDEGNSVVVAVVDPTDILGRGETEKRIRFLDLRVVFEPKRVSRNGLRLTRCGGQSVPAYSVARSAEADCAFFQQLRILLIGAGGREHSLAWKLSQSPRVDKIFVAPGQLVLSLPRSVP